MPETQTQIQIGKQGITENFMNSLKNSFKNHKNVKVSVLKKRFLQLKSKESRISQQSFLDNEAVSSNGNLQNHRWHKHCGRLVSTSWGKTRGASSPHDARDQSKLGSSCQSAQSRGFCNPRH